MMRWMVAALLLAGCEAEPPIQAEPSPATSSPSPSSTHPGMAPKPTPAPKRVAMSQVDPRPKKLRFSMSTMGKGLVDEYDIEVDLEHWAIAGHGTWEEKRYRIKAPKPLSAEQRKELEPALDAMQLVTDAPATCEAKKADPTIYCGSSTSIDVGGTIYASGSKSCQYVEYDDALDPHETVSRVFRSAAAP